MPGRIDAKALKKLIMEDGELAILDLREEGVFSEGHMLFASSLPLSRLELLIRDLVPRHSAPIVLCDDGDGLSERAATLLSGFGYSQVRVLEGGMKGWAGAGEVAFTGVNVPSKAFGEFVEVNYGTPNISASELHGKIKAGEDMVVLDSRPFEEYHRMNIPTGINVPGAELAHRVHDIAPSPDTLVVVNCAGRTRSIIGAQSLINAGIPNKVMALSNGTMGWELSGFENERGSEKRVLESSASGTAKALQAASRVAKRFGVDTIDLTRLDGWIAELEARTLYIFDVRNPEEYWAGHLPGSVWAPGGQLVQATDKYAATRNSRMVLVDDNNVRATMTASWLLQMGWKDVVVLEGGLSGDWLETGPRRAEIPGLHDAGVDEISPRELETLLANDTAVLIDLGPSPEYRQGHIPGAWFAVRSRLEKALETVPTKSRLVLTSGDGVIAWLVAGEAEELVSQPVSVLTGGTAAWAWAGLPLTKGEENMADTTNDVWLRPYDRLSGVEDAMKTYLSWEGDLVEQLQRDGSTKFRLFPDNA
ncbi:MAG: rhodanese-like domain-containing protein [Rhodospirillales bacterium]|nr:rhodanese-like domain-containing protein [Rhodospirillales bacterium]